MSIAYLNPQRGAVVSVLESLLEEARRGDLIGFIAAGFPRAGTPFRAAGGDMPLSQLPYAIASLECEKARMVEALNDMMDSSDDNEPSPGLTA